VAGGDRGDGDGNGDGNGNGNVGRARRDAATWLRWVPGRSRRSVGSGSARRVPL
jgi:hypothetical protein